MKNLKRKYGLTDEFSRTCRLSRSRPIQKWHEVLDDYPVLQQAVINANKHNRVNFTVQQRQRKGESDVRRVCKRAFGTEGKIAWGSGSWRKGQASGVLLKILQKDRNLRNRIQKVSEINTSCKCSDCLDIPKMVHPIHQNREVWGMYQCQNIDCFMTWHRDKGGVGGIFRRAYCGEFNLPLPVTYSVTGDAAVRKRPRQHDTNVGDELRAKR